MKLPCEECGGKCCTYPTFTKKEFDEVKKIYGLPIFSLVKDLGGVVVPHLADGTCPYLKQGKCSVYAHRPKGCRLYGTIPAMPCMYVDPVGAATQVHINLEANMRQFGVSIESN
jgi:Fe-S-cluster containining protein